MSPASSMPASIAQGAYAYRTDAPSQAAATSGDQAAQRVDDAGRRRPSPVDSAEISPRARELSEQDGTGQRAEAADRQVAEERRAAERQVDRQQVDRQRGEGRLDLIA